MRKIVHIGRGDFGEVFAKIEITTPEAPGVNNRPGVLSISGVEGPKPNGDARGSCGQILHSVTFHDYAPGWDHGLMVKFLQTWDRWHLNDMRAGCEHQRSAWWPQEDVEVVSYGLTTEAYQRRNKLVENAALWAAHGKVQDYSPEDRALLGLKDWFCTRFAPPDADDPLSGCYEVKKRETKAAGWVKENEHPRGLLCKACEVCGYKYGSAWLSEQLPQDVIDFLGTLPESDLSPAWV